MTDSLRALVKRCNEFFALGGLWNAELMPPDKISMLVLDCRDGLEAALAAIVAQPVSYDFEAEAQRVIEAIEPKRGATMTVICALHEAFEAGQRAAIVAQPQPAVCPHCQLPSVLPEVCTPEIRDVQNAQIARDGELYASGYFAGLNIGREERAAIVAHPTYCEQCGRVECQCDYPKQSNRAAIVAPQPEIDVEAMRERLHLTFGGGHKDAATIEAFHHGMDTVCNVLASYQKGEQTNGILSGLDRLARQPQKQEKE